MSLQLDLQRVPFGDVGSLTAMSGLREIDISYSTKLLFVDLSALRCLEVVAIDSSDVQELRLFGGPALRHLNASHNGRKHYACTN